jgi:hypothetical protein
MVMSMLGNRVGKEKKKKTNMLRALACSGRQAGKLAHSLEGNGKKTNTQQGRSTIVALANPKSTVQEKAPAAPARESPQTSSTSPKASPPSNTPKQSSCGVANTSEHKGCHYCLPAAAAATSTWALLPRRRTSWAASRRPAAAWRAAGSGP